MISLTEKAIGEIKRIMQEQNMDLNENALRIGLQGGGCSGYSYVLEFEKKENINELNDTVYNFDGIEARMDRRHENYLNGTKIDFYSEIQKRGFIFDNPNAVKNCGCGSSFSCE